MATYYSPYDGRNYRLRLEVNQVSQSIENNTSSITYALYFENGWYTFASFQSTGSLVINGVTEWSLAGAYSSATSFNSEKLIKSGTMTIPHNSDGTKSLSLSASFKTNNVGDFGTTTTLVISDSLVLTTIPRASTITRTHLSRALGETQTLTITRASTSFTHALRYRVGTGAWVSLASSIATSYNWTLADAIANSMPTLSGTITVECTTFSGSTQIGSPTTTTFTVTIPDTSTFRPNASITSASVIDGLGGLFVQSKSRIRVQSSGSGKFGAGITQYIAIIDGSTLYGTDVTSAVINKSGTISITLRVTDTRGLFTDVSTSVTFQAYFPPKINSFYVSRSPTDQDIDLWASVDIEIAPISNQNSKYYRLRYRQIGGTWILLFESTSYYVRSTTHTGASILLADKSYEIELFLQDSFTSATHTLAVGTAFELVNYSSSGKGIAFGKVSEKDAFEVGMMADFYEDVTFHPNVQKRGGLHRPYVIGAVLSSPGWYRVAKFQAVGINRFFVYGAIFEMVLSSAFVNTSNEAHKITMLGSYYNTSVYTQKVVNVSNLKGIRWCVGPNDTCYIEIYYHGTVANTIHFGLLSMTATEIYFAGYEPFTPAETGWSEFGIDTNLTW